MLYKLDGGIDHILIDEAQDTNPEQWQVVAALAEEFFAGAGARDNVTARSSRSATRSSRSTPSRAPIPAIFAERQPISPRRVRDAEAGFERLKLTWSFRSTDDVLSAVDRVFAGDERAAG